MTHSSRDMPAPSEYELKAWDDLVSQRARPTRRATRALEDSAGKTIEKVTNSKVGKAVATGARKSGQAISNAIPDSAKQMAKEAGESVQIDWVKDVAKSTGQTLMRVSRIGLTPSGVVKAHQRKGHEVERLLDVRALDLEMVDVVRGRNVDLAYAAVGAVSGAGTGLWITGGEVVAGSGVGTAPGAGTVAGAMAVDLAAVIGLSSRAVGQVALAYGYDPEDATEKAFVASVVNFSTASTTAAKEAAFADIAKLGQLLVRGRPWRVLNETVLARVAQTITKKIGVRLTQRSLGKLIPFVGVGVGAVMNFSTLESVVDSANIAYRRRFLLEKYPHLNEDGDIKVAEKFADQIDNDEAEEVISVADELSGLTESVEETNQ